ncbi:GNAT family N-acetyltransferase [Pseudoalteromonas distincta]|uniref:GNAT family N-acetyltransferase n=1 Tax=Pseudoalteromonas distincta TaxID=77608 RepID=UPI0032E2166F
MPENIKIVTERLILKLLNPLPTSEKSEPTYFGLWQISELQTGLPIGCILVKPMNLFSELPDFENIEFGWRFIERSWGNGYATEAASNLFDKVSNQKGIKIISATAEKSNQASIRVMDKLGMEFVKDITLMVEQKEVESVLYSKKLS